MKKYQTITVKVFTLALVVLFFCSSGYGQADANGPAVQGRQKKANASFVKMVDFYLRDGGFVFGRVLTDDSKKVVIERRQQSSMVVTTYSRKQIDSRTLKIKKIPEYRYYLDLAEYFSGRTGDFKDDPDDFIGAIRYYEKARQLIAESLGAESERVRQVEDKIKRLKADREIWTEQAQSRSKLKALEFEATLESRLKELENKVEAGSKRIDESLTRMEKIIADMQAGFQDMEKGLSQTNREILVELNVLRGWIEANRKLIDEVDSQYHRSYYYHPRRRPREKDKDIVPVPDANEQGK